MNMSMLQVSLYHRKFNQYTNKEESTRIIGENAKDIHEATLIVKSFECAMMELNAEANGIKYAIDVTDENGELKWV